MFCPNCNVGAADPGAEECPLCGYSFTESATQVLPATDELADSVRRQLGREFHIERQIGSGGMSLVYSARDLELRRTVAIKVLPLQLSFGPDGAERFRREATIAAGLDHPNIVPVYRSGATASLLWYSMKLVKGETLAHLLARRGSLELVACVDILSQMASALNHAHRRGVVHRDVKPANVILDEDGWVHVCDFGVAKAFGAVGLTRSGGTVGTPSYMSPEQCYGSDVTSRADQYSLGVIAYECLTGKPPFVADSIGEYVRLHCLEPPPDVRTLRPDIPDHVAMAVARALSKAPEDRFADVVDFAAAIGGRTSRTVVGAETVAAGEGTPTPETRRPQAGGHRARSQWRVSPQRLGGYGLAGLAAALLSLALPGPVRPAVRPSPALADSASVAEAGVLDAGAPNGGTLMITSRPWAKVYVNGVHVGTTPTARGIRVTPGRHVIRLEQDGFAPFEQWVELAADDTVRLTSIELTPTPR
ncbi:MAG TPA: serine/threonine-protein kinase [Gemmatimonadales bacterium]|jgi:serine/threonine-protein kinase